MSKNYAKQGIFPSDVTVSCYQLFFSPEDSINIARKKWYDYLDNDCKFFWDVYSNVIQITTLSIYDITKLNDIKEIIWFINPIGMQYLVQTPEIYDKMMFVHQQAYSIENWVHSRHKSFYVWMMFGWCQSPKEIPKLRLRRTSKTNRT